MCETMERERVCVCKRERERERERERSSVKSLQMIRRREGSEKKSKGE